MSAQHYRLYRLSENGGMHLADWIRAETDEEAIEQALRIEHGARKVEVWQRNRLVAALDTQESRARSNI